MARGGTSRGMAHKSPEKPDPDEPTVMRDVKFEPQLKPVTMRKEGEAGDAAAGQESEDA